MGPQPWRPNPQGGSFWCPQTNIHGAGPNHKVQCSHAQAPNSRPRIFRNGGRSQSTEHEAHAPHQHLLPLDPYIGQSLAPSLRVRRQTKVQPTIPNPHNPTMAAHVIPAHPLNIRITGRGLLLLRNTMQTARQVLRRQLQHPRSILL